MSSVAGGNGPTEPATQLQQFVDLPAGDESAALVLSTAPPSPERITPSVTKHASILDLRRAKAAQRSYSFDEVYGAYIEPLSSASQSDSAMTLPSSTFTAPAPSTSKFPQSLYGPHFERMPALGEGAAPSRSFSDLCRENEAAALQGHGSAGVRRWTSEWARACEMPATSLGMVGARLRALRSLSSDFAAYAGTVVGRILEERALPRAQRSVVPVPGFEHVQLHNGNVFVLATAPPFVELYGSREAAYRAARNEVRAIRTLLAAPHIDLFPPLCACVSYLGVTVFASAPLPVGDPSATFAHGGPAGPKDFIQKPVGAALAHEIADFIPLQQHSVNAAALSASAEGGAKGLGESMAVPVASPTSSPLVTPLPFDMKIVHSAVHNANFVIDAGRLCPPAVCLKEYSRYGPREDQLAQRNICRHPVEDVARSSLSVRFRPEFVRRTCHLQLNVDAGTGTQPQAASESIGFAVMTMMTKSLPAARDALIMRAFNRALRPIDISTVLHEHGVNLRYMGRICRDLKASTSARQVEAREEVIAMLEREMAVRAWKSLLYDHLATVEDTRPGALDGVVVAYVQYLVMAKPDAATFWELQLEPRMEAKFDYSCRPVISYDEVVAMQLASGGARSHTATKDPTSLQVYRAPNSAKKRVETLPCPLNWKEVAPGRMALVPDESAAQQQEQQPSAPSEPAASPVTNMSMTEPAPRPAESATGDDPASDGKYSALFPLIGLTARTNSTIMFRALELINAELSSDMRGKKIYVSAKPVLRSCAALTEITPTMHKIEQLVGTTPLEEVCLSEDSVDVCRTVGDAAEDEAAHFYAISDSDPRALACLPHIAACAFRLDDTVKAYQSIVRFMEARRGSPNRWVAGKTFVDCGLQLIRQHRYERAEAAFVDGISSLRAGAGGTIESEGVAIHLHSIASSIVDAMLTGGLVLPADRVQHVIDYFVFACHVLEDVRSPLVPDVLAAVAKLRRSLASHMRCPRTGKPVSHIVVVGLDDDGDMSTIDANSLLGATAATNRLSTLPSKDATSGTTGGGRSAATTTATKGAGGRRRRDDAMSRTRTMSTDESGGITDVFTRHTLPSITHWMVSGDVSGNSNTVTSPSANEKASSGSTTAAAAPAAEPVTPPPGTAQQQSSQAPQAANSDPQAAPTTPATIRTPGTSATSAAAAPSEASSAPTLPACRIMKGIASSKVVLRPSNYLCASCASSAADAKHHEPVMVDVARLLIRAVGIMRQRVADGVTRPLGDALLGRCLVDLGSIRGDPPLLTAGIADLQRVYGEFSRPVVTATIRLAEVLFARSIVPNPPTGGHPRDLARLQSCEDTLHQLLSTVLSRCASDPSVYETELNTIVNLNLATLMAYDTVPAAKREHAGVHQLVEVLEQSLPPTHQLLGRALNLAVRYYIKIAGIYDEQAGQRSTALHTAAAFALRLVTCVVAGGDIDIVETAIKDVRDRIVRPLRGSASSTDRNAASTIAEDIKRAVARGPAAVSQHNVVQTEVALLEEVFKTQPKVVEETAQSAAFAIELKSLRASLLDAAQRIRRHNDRGDAYCAQQFRRMDQCRRRAAEIAGVVKSSDGVAKARAVLELYDELLRVKKAPQEGEAGTAGAEDDATGSSGQEAPTASPTGPTAYESPYACLPNGFDVDDSALPNAISDVVEASAVDDLKRRGKARANLASHPPAAALADRDKGTAAQLRKAHTHLALAASKKTFTRTPGGIGGGVAKSAPSGKAP